MTIEQPASVAVNLMGNYYICMPKKHVISVYGKNGDYLFNFDQACLQNTPSNSKFEMRNLSQVVLVWGRQAPHEFFKLKILVAI